MSQFVSYVTIIHVIYIYSDMHFIFLAHKEDKKTYLDVITSPSMLLFSIFLEFFRFIGLSQFLYGSAPTADGVTHVCHPSNNNSNKKNTYIKKT